MNTDKNGMLDANRANWRELNQLPSVELNNKPHGQPAFGHRRLDHL
jgi:hypothetical protein